MEKTPEGKILKSDVSIAKNYLEQEHLNQLQRLVTAYMDFPSRIDMHYKSTPKDWVQ